jgi:hypothetical protein
MLTQQKKATQQQKNDAEMDKSKKKIYILEIYRE